MWKMWSTSKKNSEVRFGSFISKGMKGIQEKLKTDFARGVKPTDLALREQHFGTNRKAPAKITPFYKLFFGALDDFMLKLLLVCAVISISIEVAFAAPADRSHGNNYIVL